MARTTYGSLEIELAKQRGMRPFILFRLVSYGPDHGKSVYYFSSGQCETVSDSGDFNRTWDPSLVSVGAITESISSDGGLSDISGVTITLQNGVKETDSGLTGTLASAGVQTVTMSASADGIILPRDILRIEREKLRVTSVNGTSVGVLRAQLGTTGIVHTSKPVLMLRQRHNEILDVGSAGRMFGEVFFAALVEIDSGSGSYDYATKTLTESPAKDFAAVTNLDDGCVIYLQPRGGSDYYGVVASTTSTTLVLEDDPIGHDTDVDYWIGRIRDPIESANPDAYAEVVGKVRLISYNDEAITLTILPTEHDRAIPRTIIGPETFPLAPSDEIGKSIPILWGEVGMDPSPTPLQYPRQHIPLVGVEPARYMYYAWGDSGTEMGYRLDSGSILVSDGAGEEATILGREVATIDHQSGGVEQKVTLHTYARIIDSFGVVGYKIAGITSGIGDVSQDALDGIVVRGEILNTGDYVHMRGARWAANFLYDNTTEKFNITVYHDDEMLMNPRVRVVAWHDDGDLIEDPVLTCELNWTAGATSTLGIASTSGLAVGDIIQVEDDRMEITAVDINSINVASRGDYGSSDVTHNVGTSIYIIPSINSYLDSFSLDLTTPWSKAWVTGDNYGNVALEGLNIWVENAAADDFRLHDVHIEIGGYYQPAFSTESMPRAVILDGGVGVNVTTAGPSFTDVETAYADGSEVSGSNEILVQPDEIWEAVARHRDCAGVKTNEVSRDGDSFWTGIKMGFLMTGPTSWHKWSEAFCKAFRAIHRFAPHRHGSAAPYGWGVERLQALPTNAVSSSFAFIEDSNIAEISSPEFKEEEAINDLEVWYAHDVITGNPQRVTYINTIQEEAPEELFEDIISSASTLVVLRDNVAGITITVADDSNTTLTIDGGNWAAPDILKPGTVLWIDETAAEMVVVASVTSSAIIVVARGFLNSTPAAHTGKAIQVHKMVPKEHGKMDMQGTDTTINTNEALSDSDTRLDVTPNPIGTISVNDFITIDDEAMKVTDVQDTYIDITRAQKGTVAASHSTATNIYDWLTSRTTITSTFFTVGPDFQFVRAGDKLRIVTDAAETYETRTVTAVSDDNLTLTIDSDITGVADGLYFTVGDNIFMCGSEIMGIRVNDFSNNLSIDRGLFGTTAQAWVAGTKIWAVGANSRRWTSTGTEIDQNGNTVGATDEREAEALFCLSEIGRVQKRKIHVPYVWDDDTARDIRNREWDRLWRIPLYIKVVGMLDSSPVEVGDLVTVDHHILPKHLYDGAINVKFEVLRTERRLYNSRGGVIGPQSGRITFHLRSLR